MNSTVADYLVRKDSKLAPLVERFRDVEILKRNNHFLSLVESVICQQLSEKAGATIIRRFTELFQPGEPTPQSVSVKCVHELRSAGISYAKCLYIQSVASLFLQTQNHPISFDTMDNDSVIRTLTKIKGIGRWTAEMFLIFSLGRPDVFSAGDAGLIRAINILYQKKKAFTTKQILQLSHRWSPYRSYACLLLWKSLDA